jgi:hypothetical protein
MELHDLSNRFTYHPPQDAVTISLHQACRNHGKELAYWLNDNLPESREKSLAITKLEEVVMWANAAVARQPVKE